MRMTFAGWQLRIAPPHRHCPARPLPYRGGNCMQTAAGGILSCLIQLFVTPIPWPPLLDTYFVQVFATPERVPSSRDRPYLTPRTTVGLMTRYSASVRGERGGLKPALPRGLPSSRLLYMLPIIPRRYPTSLHDWPISTHKTRVSS